MAESGRPLSPHLQIYKPQLTSLLSITHRGTGVILSLGALLLSGWLAGLATGEQTFNYLQAYLNTWYGQFVLIGFMFSLYYHLCNGVRHLFWDAGLGLTIKTTYRSGYATIIASIILTALTFILGN